MKLDSAPIARLDVPSPVLALVAFDDVACAGGPGGLAVGPVGAAFRWRALPGFAVAAAARPADRTVIVGGPDGLARLEGDVVRRAETSGGTYPVAAVVAVGSTVLAGTLGGGVLRSEDTGHTWVPATYGLPSPEVTALHRVDEATVLAGTTAGICRSPNVGRAWRVVAGTEAVSVAALGGSDGGRVIAVGEDGVVLGSENGGRTWERRGALPSGAIPVSMWVAGGADGMGDVGDGTRNGNGDGAVLVGCATYGILRSADGGRHWEQASGVVAFTFAEVAGGIVAGTATGLVDSRDGGRTWRPSGAPPVHDVSRLVGVGDALFAWGATAGLHRVDGSTTTELGGVPLPLAAVEPCPCGGLTIATSEGLWAVGFDGRVDAVSRGGAVHLVAYGPETGWAAARDGSLLLRTDDHGRTWAATEPPWGSVEVVALRSLRAGSVAATYDPTAAVIDLWRTTDDGWTHSSRAPAVTPAVAITVDPPAAVLGTTLLIEEADGRWRQGRGPDGMIRRLTGYDAALLALTDTCLAYSADRGRTWREPPLPVPPRDVLDVVLLSDRMCLLVAGGEIHQLPR